MKYLSLDIEASGPVPGIYYMASYGLVPVKKDRSGVWVVDAENTFYSELVPTTNNEQPQAMRVHKLTRAYLEGNGERASESLRRFREWKNEVGKCMVAAAPSSFDFPWLNYYSWKYLMEGVVGWDSLDIGSFGEGLVGERWREKIGGLGFSPYVNPCPHNALQDALEQAHELAWLLNYRRELERRMG